MALGILPLVLLNIRLVTPLRHLSSATKFRHFPRLNRMDSDVSMVLIIPCVRVSTLTLVIKVTIRLCLRVGIRSVSRSTSRNCCTPCLSAKQGLYCCVTQLCTTLVAFSLTLQKLYLVYLGRHVSNVVRSLVAASWRTTLVAVGKAHVLIQTLCRPLSSLATVSRKVALIVQRHIGEGVPVVSGSIVLNRSSNTTLTSLASILLPAWKTPRNDLVEILVLPKTLVIPAPAQFPLRKSWI